MMDPLFLAEGRTVDFTSPISKAILLACCCQ